MGVGDGDGEGVGDGDGIGSGVCRAGSCSARVAVQVSARMSASDCNKRTSRVSS